MINQGIVPPGYPYFGNVPQGAMPYEIPQQHPMGQPGAVPGSIPGQPAFKPDPNFQQQRPQMGHPQMGQPQMGQPQMGQPQMGGYNPQMQNLMYGQ